MKMAFAFRTFPALECLSLICYTCTSSYGHRKPGNIRTFYSCYLSEYYYLFIFSILVLLSKILTAVLLEMII